MTMTMTIRSDLLYGKRQWHSIHKVSIKCADLSVQVCASINENGL